MESIKPEIIVGLATQLYKDTLFIIYNQSVLGLSLVWVNHNISSHWGCHCSKWGNVPCANISQYGTVRNRKIGDMVLIGVIRHNVGEWV